MPTIELTAEALSGIAGAFISLLFSYFPKLKDKFAALSSEAKSGIMIGLLVLVTATITALDYFGAIDAGIVFDGKWMWRVLFVLLSGIVVNQGVYKISPQTEGVKLAKAERDFYSQALSGYEK